MNSAAWPGGAAAPVVTAGVDLGGTKCLGLALVDGVVRAEVQLPTPVGEGAVLSTMAEVVTALSGDVGAPTTALGVGVPGLVDREGVLRFAPN
ncbi:MAG: ROK family protein, partial [Actinomycetota bacterium]|nr:ROK family protein [Actinomycetota bacterium]